MLKNMFPNHTSLTPKIRLSKFTGEWVETNLENCVYFLDNKRIPLNQHIRDQMDNLYPYYGAAGIIDYVEDYIFDEDLILLGEDGTIVPTLASGKYWVSNHAHVLRNKKGINLYFLYNSLRRINFKKYNTGTIQPKLNKKTAKKIKIKVPSIKEQEKIVKILNSIDKKIYLISTKCDKLKQFKKGLLQKMFC